MQMQMQKVMNSLFDIPNLIELYEVLQIIKLDQENYFNSKQLEQHHTKINILFKYSFLDEIQQYLNSLAKHNPNQSLYNSIQSYVFLKSLEYNLKMQHNQFLKSSNYLNKLEQQYLQPIDTITKPETIAFKLLYYSAKLLTTLDNVDQQFIKYYKLLENTQFSDTKMPYEMQMLQPSTLLFQIPFPYFAQIIASSYILIQMLNNKQYEDFTEENYIYQTELITKLVANRFHSQIIKSLSIMIDVTWNIVNLSELISTTLESFTDSSILQRMAFTFANVHRGFKVLKIVIDESIFKYFIEPILIQYSDITDDSDQKINFKPQVKIIFHGLEDINLENPKATKLNLEILVQIAENEFFQVGKDSDPVLFWNYDKLQQFNLISNILLTSIIQLLQNCFEFMPKDPKLYFDYISAKANSKKFTIQKSELNALISKWYTAEKNHIKTSIDTIISFVEALEFNVIKTESTLQKDLQYYKSGGKPFELNKDKLHKSLIGAGFQLHFDLIYKIEGQTILNLTNEIEMTLSQLQIHTGRIRQLVQMIKKSFISFK